MNLSRLVTWGVTNQDVLVVATIWYLYHLSLYQSGKSRADLWQFAGLVALERLIERSNRACDLDYHQRQQVRLLEGREKCEIKLTKPLKFMTGRKDCITDRKRTYKTGKKEVFLKQVLRIQKLNDCKNFCGLLRKHKL